MFFFTLVGTYVVCVIIWLFHETTMTLTEKTLLNREVKNIPKPKLPTYPHKGVLTMALHRNETYWLNVTSSLDEFSFQISCVRFEYVLNHFRSFDIHLDTLTGDQTLR